MVDYTKPDLTGIPDQRPHSGFYGNTVGAQLVFWDSQWHLVTYPTLVQLKSRTDRHDDPEPGGSMAG